MKKKVLIISLWNSIHNEKWLANFTNQDFKFCIFLQISQNIENLN